MTQQYLPLGAFNAKCRHMPESYYERWESLYKAHKRASRSGSPKSALNAAKRLAEHENNHCTKDATLEAFEALIPSGEYHSDGAPNIGLAIQNAKRGGLSDEVCAILNLETEKGEA